MSEPRLTAVEDINDLQRFLNVLYGETAGYVYSPVLDRAKDSKAEGYFTQHFFKWPDQRVDLIKHIITQSRSLDVYVAPALFEKENSRREFVKGSHVVWCEFDGAVPDFEASSLVPAPSMRVQSSETGFEHWYWILADFLTDVDKLEEINRGLTYVLGADASGWDADQILRPPNTKNFKRDKPVQLLQLDPLGIKVGNFGSLPRPESSVVLFSEADLLDALEIVAKYEWTRPNFEVFRNKPPVGERSTALMRLGFICAEMKMKDVEIFSVLWNADDRWEKFKGRRDREKRLCDIISKVRIKYPDDDSLLNNLPIFDAVTFLNSEVNIEWIVPDLLQAKGSMLLSGPPGVGKTQISLRFAIAMALGHSFLEYSVTAPKKLMFFSLEMGHADLKYFLSQMVSHLPPAQLDLLSKNLFLIPLGEALYLDDDAVRKTIDTVFGEYEPDGMFFDSLGSSTPDELSSESTAKSIMDWNERIRNRYGIFTWWIHHNRKANALNKAPNKLSDVFGSQYITARPTSVFCVWPGKPGSPHLKIIPLKQRLAQLPSPFTIERMDGLDFKRIADDEFEANDAGLTVIEYKQDNTPPESYKAGGQVTF